MPTYEYRCTRCRHMFDIYQAVGEAAPSCPQCGAATQKVFASVGLIFKGSGFHTTDYRKAAGGNGEDAKSGSDAPKEPSAAPSPASAAAPPSSSSSGDKSPTVKSSS